MGLPWWSSGEDSVSNVGGLGSIPCKGTRSHMLQLRLRQAKQINFFKKPQEYEETFAKYLHSLEPDFIVNSKFLQLMLVVYREPS